MARLPISEKAKELTSKVLTPEGQAYLRGMQLYDKVLLTHYANRLQMMLDADEQILQMMDDEYKKKVLFAQNYEFNFFQIFKQFLFIFLGAFLIVCFIILFLYLGFQLYLYLRDFQKKRKDSWTLSDEEFEILKQNYYYVL